MSLDRVFVIGAGLMGHGIAQVMAAAGHQVALYEPEVARAEAGRARIGANLERSVAKGRISDDDRRAQRWAAGKDAGSMPSSTFRRNIDFPGTRKYVDSIIDRYAFYKRRGRM